ncbi:MAG: GreA/GreB family elongation factor [Gelidibacter sp.]
MKYGKLILEKKEYVMIKRLLNLTNDYKDSIQKIALTKFAKEIESAEILDDDKIPDDVVRINSEITIATKDGWQYTFLVVLPAESNNSQKKISLLVPMGAAVLGYAKDDCISWTFPGGDKDIIILEVKQNNIIKLNIA